jgi:hypothetical protein
VYGAKKKLTKRFETNTLLRGHKMGAIKDYSYTVIFEPLERGGYQSIVPALPEIMTAGRTLKEARRMARDAIRSRLTLPDGGPFRAEPLG